ncbi:MAG: hypothetical protein ACI9KE_004655 [Polyangiales bacterium]
MVHRIFPQMAENTRFRMTLFSLRSMALAVILSASFTFPAALQAQRRRDAASGDDSPRVVATLADLDRLTLELASPNDDITRAAIDSLQVIDHPRIVPPLAGLLRSGRSDIVVDKALDALRGLGHESAIEVLTEFTNHRRASARRRAFQALSAIEDGRVAAIIERGLRDSDRSVRGVAALALGEIGATSSLGTLFVALERNVIEAAIAIGKLGNAASIERFDGFLGNEPLGVMLSGYDEYLRRDDVPIEAKTAIVERLGETAGVMVRQFLQNYLRWFPVRSRNRELLALRDLVNETIQTIPETSTGTTIRNGAAQ